MNPIEAAHQYLKYGGDWIEYTQQMTQEELLDFWDEVWTQRNLQEEEYELYDRYEQTPMPDWADY